MNANNSKREHLSRLRQEVARSVQEMQELLRALLHPRSMMVGSFYEMYKKCGRTSCPCTKGKLHGPFPVLSVSRAGHRSTRSVPRKRAGEIRKRAEAYRDFMRDLRRLRKCMKQLVELLVAIRDASTESGL